jgi:hypothetical protein
MFTSMSILISSIVACCVFGVAAFVFFILWILSFLRGGLQKKCPKCAALVPRAALYCNHCGNPVPAENSPRGGRKSFFTVFLVSIIAVAISVAGIVYGAVSTGIGVSECVTVAFNLDQQSTSNGWNITFDTVKSGWLEKNIVIKNSSPKALHFQSHLKSGDMRLEVSQGDEKSSVELTDANISSVDLSKFDNGRVAIKVVFDNANSGGVSFWWE